MGHGLAENHDLVKGYGQGLFVTAKKLLEALPKHVFNTP
jgi:hypothetical protein